MRIDFVGNAHTCYSGFVSLQKRGTGDKMIPFSCEFEQKVADMTPEDAKKYTDTVSARWRPPLFIVA